MSRATVIVAIALTLIAATGCSGGSTQDREGASLAPIDVESPSRGDVVSSPLELRGTANVFEAVFEAEVRSRTGEKLGAAIVTASCGTGCRGTFDDEVPFDPGDADRVTLVVFERSARDGSRIHEVRIPLVVR